MYRNKKTGNIMRIAISGTHFIGKTTFIQDFIKIHPDYKWEMEPYSILQGENPTEFSEEPSLESLIEQLDYSIDQLNQSADESNLIFDRCPIDFIAYALWTLRQDGIDIHNSEISERFDQIKEALSTLDLIAFLPITTEHLVDYTEENSAYRKAIDTGFKKIYRDDLYDLFPEYGHPRIIEIWGDRLDRVRKLESYL